MPIDRLLKDKRTPEEIELLNKASNHALNLLGVVYRNDTLASPSRYASRYRARRFAPAKIQARTPRPYSSIELRPDDTK